MTALLQVGYVVFIYLCTRQSYFVQKRDGLESAEMPLEKSISSEEKMKYSKMAVVLLVVVFMTTACGLPFPVHVVTPSQAFEPAPRPELECLTVESADDFIVTLHEEIGVKTDFSGSVPEGSRTGYWLEPGDYIIGFTLGENALASIEPVNLTSFTLIVNECETTHWLEITLGEGVWLWVEHEQVSPPGQQL